MNDNVLISARHLSVAYQDKLVLEDITFDIRRGEFWGVLGPNGSGKTTLLRTILGLTLPISGSIQIFGKNPAELGVERDRIGYVPQHALIDFNFPIRVKDVVLLGRSRKIGIGKRAGESDLEAVDAAMKLVEITDLANRQIGRLSGGQRQRVLIARALALQPEILLLDEPTAALDVNAAESFYEWLHAMHEKMKLTLVLVSHDIGVVSRYVSAVACLNRTLVAHGVPAEVLAGDTLEKMYGCDAMLFGHGAVPHMVVTPAKSGGHTH
ncbi:metal ABC transporter ATP-binding protein [candidate division KSB1 bacterium]|nr:metal ABC transporter ATP-binding protein [candidate division KSB1 bacterium]RQW04400.1 MAG: metal ABC transporter ATP-binding protein [candidate division KSB1 bacterium]